MLFLFYGERFISPGLAAILNGTVPLWTFFAALFINSHPTFSITKLMGVLIALIGLIFVFFPALVLDYHRDYIIGAVSVLLMAFSYTFSNLLNERMFAQEKKINFQANLYHQMWSSTIFLGIISLTFEKWPSLHSLTHVMPLIFSIIYLGFFSTALGWIIFFFIIREWGAIRASTVMYIVPLVALTWDFLLFHTVPRWTEATGVVGVLLGVFLLQWRSSAQQAPALKTAQHEK
jgi:drug/metabolite transporter (DMT)-like permease